MGIKIKENNMYIGDGDSLGNMLLNQKTKCTKCGTEITFQTGAKLAKAKGIKDNVVMCSSCNSVYEVYIAPGCMDLTKNVTGEYLEYFKPEEIEKMLQTKCAKCESVITYKTGAKLAKSKGIEDNVVMCDSCKSVYKVYLAPCSMDLTENVTGEYFKREEIEKMLREDRNLIIIYLVCLALPTLLYAVDLLPFLDGSGFWGLLLCIGAGIGLLVLFQSLRNMFGGKKK